jgi:hypothetical protein
VDFFLFILVAAILFIRPTDFISGLESVPLYMIAIVPCILMSWHKLAPQFTSAGLRRRPVLAFGVGILLISILLSLPGGRIAIGLNFAFEYSKVLIFYALILAQVNSPRRLKLFLGCLVGIILTPTLLAVLNYHGYIHIQAFEAINEGDKAIGQGEGIRRLVATGNFADPNDVCEIVNCAMIFALYGLLDRGRGLRRIIWLAPLAVLGHALALTHSRGGFLAAVVGLMVLFRSRFRGIRSLVLAGIVLGLMLVLFAGRQTSISTSSGTGQQRIQIWNDSLSLLVRTGLIGIGYGRFLDFEDHVAHNAFIQVYVELGLLGGTLFFGQYFYCLKNLKELGSKRVTLPDAEARRLQPFVLAAAASFATSEMSLTNPFSPSTYAMLGLATAFIRMADPSPPLPELNLSRRLVRRIILLSCLFLACLYLFARTMVRYDH